MKVIAKYHVDADTKLQASLRSRGIEVELGYSFVVVSEDRRDFTEVDHLLTSSGASRYFETTFTKKEISEASYCAIFCRRHVGYPQPENLNFLEEVYESVCRSCGSLGEQVHPFKIKHSVLKKGLDIFQLNWVFDQFFVSRNLFEQVFSQLGVEAREVICFDSGERSNSHVQIVIPKPDFGFAAGKLVGGPCDQCGKSRFEYHMRGLFPSLQRGTDLPIFSPNTLFGSDDVARHQVVISESLREDIEKTAPRLLQYWPLEP